MSHSNRSSIISSKHSLSPAHSDDDVVSADWVDVVEEDDHEVESLQSEISDPEDDGVWHHNVRERIRRFSIATKQSISHFLNPSAYLISRGLTLLDIEELSMLYPLSRRQFCSLMDEFLALCGVDIYDEEQNDRKVVPITLDMMMQCQYLKYNPFKRRIAEIFQQDLRDEDGNDKEEVTFFDFCQCLSVFSVETPKTAKIRFAFRIYDIEDDGFISEENLFDVLKLIIGDKFEDDQIDVIVTDTFSKCQVNHDGNVDYPEFHSIVGVGDIIGNYTINF